MLVRMQHPADGTRNPASSPNAAVCQNFHRCGLCNKGFERRDLRDRHKRRCLQALSRPRKSKRKSCLSCAASKLGCDLAFPSCSRCISRNQRCEYAAATQGPAQDRLVDDGSIVPQLRAENEEINQRMFGQQSNGASDNEAPSLADSQFNLSTADMRILLANGYDASFPKGSNTAVNISTDLDAVDESNERFLVPPFQLGRTRLRAQEHMRARAPHESQQMDLSFDQSMNLETSLGNSSRDHQSDIDYMSDWRRNSGAASTSITSDVESLSIWRPVQWLSKTAANISEKDQQMSWGDDTFQDPILGPTNGGTFDLLGSFGIPGSRQLTSAARENERIPSVPTFEPISWKPPLPWDSNAAAPLAKKNQLSARNNANITSRSGGDRPQKRTAPRSEQTRRPSKASQPESIDRSPRSAECPFHKMATDDDLIKALLEYPQVMLKRGTYPPFVHHRLYRCMEGDVLEPLANAFCCVSAHNAALPSSETFVHIMMNKERDRLVKSFRLWGNSDIEALAAVHAMSVYQIVGFFGSTAEQARCAELQHHFFLKMARRLTQHLLPPSDEADLDESSWRKWIIHESIRRTAFLVNIINNLSCRTQKQNPYFYETLDADLILNMPLPAPDVMWRATSPEEWIAAKNSLGPVGLTQLKLTAKTLREKYGGNGVGVSVGDSDGEARSSGGIGRNIRGSASGPRAEFDDLQEFTKLIMTSLSVNEPEA